MEKRYAALFTVVALLIAAPLVTGCEAAETEEPEVEGTTQQVAQVGETLTLKGTSYEVTGVEQRSVVGSSFSRVSADGVFVVVQLTLTNQKDEPATILEDAVRLVGGNGDEYTTDTDAFAAYDNQFSILQEIQPGLPKRVVAVYDVPPAAVAGAKLRVRDLFSDSTGEIDLGMT